MGLSTQIPDIRDYDLAKIDLSARSTWLAKRSKKLYPSLSIYQRDTTVIEGKKISIYEKDTVILGEKSVKKFARNPMDNLTCLTGGKMASEILYMLRPLLYGMCPKV